MRKKILILLFLFFIASPVFADNFSLKITPKSGIVRVGEEVKVEAWAEFLSVGNCRAQIWFEGWATGPNVSIPCIEEDYHSPIFNKRCVCTGIVNHKYSQAGTYEIVLSIGFGAGSIPEQRVTVNVLTSTSSVVTSINPLAVTGLATSIQSFVDRFFYGAGAWWIVILVAIFLMIGGYYIFFSYGDPKRIARGKRIVILTLTGFAIILIARGIIWFLESVLGRR